MLIENLILNLECKLRDPINDCVSFGKFSNFATATVGELSYICMNLSLGLSLILSNPPAKSENLPNATVIK